MIGDLIQTCKYSINNTPPLYCSIIDGVLGFGISMAITFILYKMIKRYYGDKK